MAREESTSCRTVTNVSSRPAVILKGACVPVGKEGNVMFTQEGKEFFFTPSGHWIVMSLKHSRLDVAILLADIKKLLHFRDSIVRETEFPEFTLLKSIIHCLGCIFEGCMAIRNMEEHGLDR